jgi:hypothetical protein
LRISAFSALTTSARLLFGVRTEIVIAVTPVGLSRGSPIVFVVWTNIRERRVRAGLRVVV